MFREAIRVKALLLSRLRAIINQRNNRIYVYDEMSTVDENAMRLGTTEIIVIAIVSALMIWLLVGLSLACYRFLIKRPEGCPPCESKDAP